MAIVGYSVFDLGASAGDENLTSSFTVNIAPAHVLAQVSLYKVHGRYMHKIGIRSFRHRPEPDGPEQTVGFTNLYWNWPSTIANQRLTSVTVGMFVSSDNELEGHLNLYFWG